MDIIGPNWFTIVFQISSSTDWNSFLESRFVSPLATILKVEDEPYCSEGGQFISAKHNLIVSYSLYIVVGNDDGDCDGER